ncbi:hypothetical protein GpartN1_g2925.t1 [Galdieria partita]|uniref:Uncharacterized protein n=1 Tax=Galdieria partita TaxID=83374 RepID=A0A9C7PVV1_9RHOD|nr:hypothetical protein GpartN1_g2925.t1 [Galdieria partita]
MELCTVDIVELFRLRALASKQYLIEKLELDETKTAWLLSTLKDQDKWKNWFLNLNDDKKFSESLRKELSLLLAESCTNLPVGFQQAIQTQMDAVQREFGCGGSILESDVTNFYWEDVFQENIRIRGVQERKNYTEYRLLDQWTNKVPLRKRQRSKAEDLHEAESSESGRVKSIACKKESSKEGTSSKKISPDSTFAYSDHSMNHVERSSSNCVLDPEEGYPLKASYRRDSFRMAEFMEKTKCFPCCDSINFSFLKESDQPVSQIETDRDVVDVEGMDDMMSWQPEQFDVFSCVPDVPLIFTKVGNHPFGQLGENGSLWNASSEVMKNCRKLMNVYQMKETFESYSNENNSNSLLPNQSDSSPTLSNAELLDSKEGGYVPCESSMLHEVIGQEAEAEKYPPQYEWQLLRGFMYSIFMQIGFTHCSQHAMDLMTDMLLEKLKKLEEGKTCSNQLVWYMNDVLETDPLKHLLHCLYRCGLIFRVQDLLHYYSVELPYLSNAISQVESEWKRRIEYLKRDCASIEGSDSYVGIVGSNKSFCDDDVSESDESNAFGEDGQLIEPFRCFGYIGNNYYLDILELRTLQGYLQVPPNIIFASQSSSTNLE